MSSRPHGIGRVKSQIYYDEYTLITTLYHINENYLVKKYIILQGIRTYVAYKVRGRTKQTTTFPNNYGGKYENSISLLEI